MRLPPHHSPFQSPSRGSLPAWIALLLPVVLALPRQAIQAAPATQTTITQATEWKVTNVENRGSWPGATFRSFFLSRTQSDASEESVRFDGVIFSEKNYRLRVLDNPGQEKTLEQVMQALEGRHFLAGVNGSYFRPNGMPLGLVIRSGETLHAQEKAHLLSGLIASSDQGIFLLRVGEELPLKSEDVLQAGPFLIDGGKPVPGLEETRVAPRTLLATDGRGTWIMGVLSPVSLAGAAGVIKAASATAFSSGMVERALNLDGGSSSALWIDTHPEPFSQGEIGQVRNFLGLQALHP